ELTISFEEAIFGVKKDIKVNKYVECDHCKGSGAQPGTSKTTCPNCNGTGEVHTQQKTPFGVFQSSAPCDKCNGTGQIIEKPCSQCGGKGKVQKNITLSVSIPAGVDNENVITLRGQGEPGTNGGPSGDLYVVISVKPHQVYKRRGQDLQIEIPISFNQAALGDELT
ncbi:MAG: DnaJ C-terminal domain-containing protein, partial [Anaerovoracaceae bacterium]